MAKCAHFDVCGIEVDTIPEGGHCILHAEDPDKDREVFAQALEDHLATGIGDFSYIYFCDTVDFEDRTFEQADFTKATFNKGVNFSGVTFNEWANFYRAVFNGEAVFYRAIFEHGSFYGATFNEIADFLEATFNEQASFKLATFEYGTFLGATFNGRVDFSGATFRLAHFSKTIFNRIVNFSGATFNDRAGFRGVTFEQADFSGPMLEEVVIEATFELPVSSLGATFNGKVDFSGATFNELADFSRTVFNTPINEEVVFAHCTFRGRALFDGSGQLMLFASGAEIDFRYVTLDPFGTIAFRNVNLRRCRFLNTDVRKIEFTSVEWRTKPPRWWLLSIKPLTWLGCRGLPGWLGGKGTACVYDELAYEDDSKKEWGRLERLYRELKQNHEDRKDYARAGDFHFRQKEMRKHNPETPTGHKVLLWLYWGISGYGERIWPAVAWLFAIVFSFAVVYLTFGIGFGGYWSALLYSAQISFLIQPDGYALEEGAQGVRLVQTVASPILLGLIALAIRQRLKR